MSEHGFPIADGETQGLLGELVQQSADGILVIDRQGVVCYANPAAEDLFSQQEEPLIGTHLGVPAVEEDSRLSLPGGGQIRMVEIRASEINWQGRRFPWRPGFSPWWMSGMPCGQIDPTGKPGRINGPWIISRSRPGRPSIPGWWRYS